jgi:hypothetical protein
MGEKGKNLAWVYSFTTKEKCVLKSWGVEMLGYMYLLVGFTKSKRKLSYFLKAEDSFTIWSKVRLGSYSPCRDWERGLIFLDDYISKGSWQVIRKGHSGVTGMVAHAYNGNYSKGRDKNL